jgi:hypothetical protein
MPPDEGKDAWKNAMAPLHFMWAGRSDAVDHMLALAVAACKP